MQREYMLENGIAEPSSSSWASPCLLVDKSDRSPRFCTDYRQVYGVTKPDAYPLPHIEDYVDQVGSARYISKFDLLKGYWQVPLSKRAREISSFITPSGLFSYTVEFWVTQRVSDLPAPDEHGCVWAAWMCCVLG